MIPHIISSLNVTVFVDGSQHIVPVGTAQYDLVRKGISEDDINAVRNAINVKQSVVNASFGRMSIKEDGVLYYDDFPLHGALSSRILTIIKDAGDASPLINFLDRLMANPSKRSVDELYGFLAANSLPITSDGYFLAYKKVRNNYKDIYSGTMDNSVGSRPSMPRNQVDDDKERTCSYGLHFCSRSYLPSFGSYASGDDRIMVVKVDPAQVVSIPQDYNNAKGRACEYLVVGELETTDGGRDVVTELKENFSFEYGVNLYPEESLFTQEESLDDDFEDEDDDFEDDFEDEDEDDEQALIAPSPLVADSTSVKASGNKLDDDTVRSILRDLDKGKKLSDIATTYNTSPRSVARIRDGESYRHIKTW
jgi:hypothetical protein